MDHKWPGGRLETFFATNVTKIDRVPWSELKQEEKDKVLPLADCGKHVYVWQTKTREPGRLRLFASKLEVKK